MRFFKVVALCLGFIAFCNLMEAVVDMNLRDPVYACKDVTILDPIDVRKLCKRKLA
jgi:hypothetical protein